MREYDRWGDDRGVDPHYLSHNGSTGMSDGLSARALLSSVRRHLGVVVGLSLSFCLLGAFIGLGLPPRFQAQGVLIIRSQPQRISNVQEVLPDQSPEMATILSEADVLRSRSVIESVVRSLALWRLPEFQNPQYPGGWSWQTLKTRLGNMWGVEGGPDAASRESALERVRPDAADAPMEAQIDLAVNKYGDHLLVQTDGHSMTIEVSYRAWTPQLAAEIVNTHIKSYQRLQVQAKAAAAQEANSWLKRQVAELQNQLQVVEAAVSQYREDHHLTGTAKDNTALSEQLASLNAQLITARADLAESEARAARMGNHRGGTNIDSKRGGDSIPEVVNSQTITALRAQEGQLIQREANLSAVYGNSYPELQRVRASLQNLRDQIAREIDRNRGAALQLVDRARAREQSMQQSIVAITTQVNIADAGLQQLQANAESIRTLLNTFEKRAEETAADPAFITSNSSLVSRASPSAVSGSPIALALAGGGGFGGLVLGCLLAHLLEIRDKTFRTSAQVQRQVQLRTISATPRAAHIRRRSPADLILNDNKSLLAEAFRLSWANIQCAVCGPEAAPLSERRSGFVLGITSAASGEGKSTHALGLARTAALAGEKVVLVDADLRRSGVSRLLDRDLGFVLGDFLQGRCTANAIIAVEEQSGVHFVPSTPLEAALTSRDLLRFAELVDYLKDRFDIVIIDLPPILGLAETVRLALITDSIALIIRWGRTERQLVQYAIDALRSAGGSPSTAILNDIDLKALRRRGYRDRTVVYADEGLYRAPPGGLDLGSQALPAVPGTSDGNPDVDGPDARTHDTRRYRSHDSVGVPTAAATDVESDLQQLFYRYQSDIRQLFNLDHRPRE